MPETSPRAPRPSPDWRDRLLAHYRRRNWRGFRRLYGLLKPGTGRREIQVACRYGSQFYLIPWDYIDGHVIGEGFYESEVLEAVRPALGPGAVLWVVGSNFGLHAVTAKWLYPETRVVAFEPLPAMAARLLENCELNAVEVELHAYALSDRNAVLPFFVNTSGNPAMSTLHPDPTGRYDRRLAVAARTAEDVIACGMAPSPTAAIVDAEGAESEVLRGLGMHLSAPDLRCLVIEAPNEFLATHQPAELYESLTAAGFSLSRLPRQENTAHLLSNFLASR